MRIFVTGISTEVGKTITSAIIVEALQADYWKPVQAGDLDNSDSHKVSRLITNSQSKIHPNSYALHTPMSPHAAAEIDSVRIAVDTIQEPTTENALVIEGAGGILVPLNDEHTILDLILPNYKVVVVSRHYLGSINHTLLTINALLDKGLEVGVVFSGNEHPTTESIILKKTGIPFLGRINEEDGFDASLVSRYAASFRERLSAFAGI